MWYVVILLNLVLILNYTDHDRGSVLRRHARFRASGRSELTVDGCLRLFFRQSMWTDWIWTYYRNVLCMSSLKKKLNADYSKKENVHVHM